MRTPSVTCSAHNAIPSITRLPTAELPTTDFPTTSTMLPTASANPPTASTGLLTAELPTTTDVPTAPANHSIVFANLSTTDPPTASTDRPTVSAELPTVDPPTTSTDLPEYQRFTLFEKLPQEIRAAIWRLGLPRRNLLVSGRRGRILRLQGTLVPPVAFSACPDSRTEALRHYARLWRARNIGSYVYISSSHDTVILYCEGRNEDDEDGGSTLNMPDRLHRDQYIYDAINGLKPGLGEIQSLAVDAAFLRDHPQHETSIHSNIYTLLRASFTGLRQLTFIARFQRPHSKKHAIIIEDLHYGTLDSIDVLYNKITQNFDSPPKIIDERGYPQEMKELKSWYEKKGPICSWKVGKVRTDESLEARQCEVYPKGVEHSDLLQLADDISRWDRDNTDHSEFYWRANHNLYPESLYELVRDENFQKFIPKNPKGPIEVGIGMRGTRG
jgi:hypothetical protein